MMLIKDIKSEQQVMVGSSHTLLEGAHTGKRCKIIQIETTKLTNLLKVKIDGVGYRVYLPSLLGLKIL